MGTKTSTKQAAKKHTPVLLLLSALLVFAVMAIMAWIFFRERMTNFDPSFFSFLMIQDEWFSPVLNRYGTALSQILPLIMVKAGADLETVLKTYSLSFVLLYIIYLLIIGVSLKDKKGIIAIVIALTLTFRETFFYATAELYQAIGLSVLLWSLFSRSLDQAGRKRTFGLILSALLVVGISFFHQLGIFTTFFVLGAEYIRRAKWKDYAALSVLAWSVIWFLFNIKILSSSAYEQERLLTMESFLNNIGQIRELSSFKYFVSFFNDHLFIPVVLSIIALVALLFRRKWILASFIGLFPLFFVLIVIVALHHEKSPLMLQNYFTVLGLFAGVLFAIVLEKRSLLICSAIVLLLGFYSLKNIYQTRYDYQARTTFIQDICEYGQQFPEKKYVMHAQHLPWEFVWVSWSLSFETLLSSEINEEQKSVTFYSTFELDTLGSHDIERPEAFMGPVFSPHWFTAPSLHEDYFSVKVGPYRVLNSKQTKEMLSDSLLRLESIQIEPHDDTLNRPSGWYNLKLDILNETNQHIGSIPKEDKGLWLYHRIINQHNIPEPLSKRQLLFDLYPDKPFTQTLSYYYPSEKNLRLEVGLFIEQDSTFYPKANVYLNTKD
jgi:hypothetical protein